LLRLPRPPSSTLFPYTTLFRSGVGHAVVGLVALLESLQDLDGLAHGGLDDVDLLEAARQRPVLLEDPAVFLEGGRADAAQLARRSEEHTSELQSRENLVCRLLL